MSKALPFIILLLCLVLLTLHARAQNAQTVQNGQTTSAISLPVSGCVYNWVNNTPGVGLPASGTGNIPSFTAINTGASPITATITATAVPNAYAYVVDGGSNLVEVVSLVTNQAILAIPVGEQPGGDVVSPDDSHVYVTNSASGSISVINTTTNSVADTIPVGNTPANIAISPDGKLVYVVNSASKSISVINTATNTVSGTIQLPYNPYNVIVSPDGSRVYVDYNTNATVLSVVNTATQKLLPNIPLNENCTGMTLSPDGTKLYLNSSSSVAVINTTTGTEIAPIPLVLYTDSESGIIPYSIVASADGSTLFAASVSSRAGTINVINTETSSVIDTIGTPAYPAYGVSLTADGSKLIVVADAVVVINTASYAKEAYIRLSNPPATSFSNYVTGASACSNTPLTFTITVTPTSSPPPVITAGAVSGEIYGCVGDASVSPSIQQFTLSAIHLNGNITASAPAGFELSLSPTGGYAASLDIAKVGGSVNNTVVYIRSSAADAAGSIAGGVTLSSPGAANQYIAVSGTVNPLPVMPAIPNQVVDNGAQTTAVNFPDDNITVNWVNDTPGIGLPANGVGNIPVFTAINNTDTVITATITATPMPAGLAFVTNTNSNNISVINVATNKVINTINTPTIPQGVSVSADGSRVYFIDGLCAVSVINTSTNAVVATIPVDFYGPKALVVGPDGSQLYVAIGGGGNYMNDNITVINTSTNLITAHIPLDGDELAVITSPDGARLYVAVYETNEVAVIDTKTNSVIKNIPVGKQPGALGVSPDGKTLYVANTIDGTVSVINTNTYATIAVLPVSQQPLGIAVSPDGSRVYVANGGYGFYGGASVASSVSVINTATNKTIASVPVGNSPSAISITADGKEVYVANSGFSNSIGGAIAPGSVSVINTATNAVSTTIAVDSIPSPNGNFISRGIGCSGAPVTFTIKVRPSPRIAAGAVAGNIAGCSGAASTSPNIQQFTVSASNLTSSITANAPAGFEISLSAGTGYVGTLSIAPQSGAVNNVTVFVRLSADAPAGLSSGTVTLSSPGAAVQTVAVTGNALASVSPSLSIAASAASICAGTSITFTATAVNGGESPVYQWAVNGNNTGENSNTFITGNLADGDVVSCTLSSNAPCATPLTTVSNSITVKVGPILNPSVSIEASQTQVCAGTPVTFTAIPVNGGDAPVYQWLVNGIATGGNGSDFTDSQLANGDVVSCILTSNAACAVPANATSNSITMSVDPLPTVNAGADETINETASLQLNATTTGDITGVTWSPTEGLSNGNILNPTASPKTTTTYIVTVQTSAGCTASDTVIIKVVLPPVVIPNTFTPNGDGINDTWNIKFLDLYANCTVQVFTRWGTRVFNSIGYGTAWNGTYNSAPLPDGTYYYVIDLGTHTGLLSGFVTIIK